MSECVMGEEQQQEEKEKEEEWHVTSAPTSPSGAVVMTAGGMRVRRRPVILPETRTNAKITPALCSAHATGGAPLAARYSAWDTNPTAAFVIRTPRDAAKGQRMTDTQACATHGPGQAWRCRELSHDSQQQEQHAAPRGIGTESRPSLSQYFSPPCSLPVAGRRRADQSH
ncbi:hypothetical protein E2C01_028582 [Portunus trituberculatus]|uniref:Uncharacterized protein n=1 Tax=Portunus trituberculatus TaxID=210409 RepID=A0A5B7EPE5_PORTR|nr:hypothetical protein [Portunus trituberculatus]